MSGLTKAAVKAALAEPLMELDDGRVQCPLCPFIAQSKQTLGPHMITHRREVGLAPPKANPGPRRANGPPPTRSVTCPACPATVQSAGLPRHLRQVHPELSPRERMEMIDVARHGPVPARALAVIEPEGNGDEHEPEESVLTDVSAVEFATGLLVTARRDGLIPARLLPSVIEWVAHTDELLTELARLSS
jgi:hypothetical protein